MKRTIEITVGTGGELNMEAKGFEGADCEKATAFLEKALGIVAVRRRKPGYRRRPRVTRRQELGS